ncbi:AB-hydrolase YheT [Ramaria rubella]|nr:AB-hydrolase YheT [Ramaria rubella]
MSVVESNLALAVPTQFYLPAGFLWLFTFAVCLFVLRLWRQNLESWPTELHVASSSVALSVPDSDRPSITLLDLLETRVPSLFKPFRPAWFLPGGHFQTSYCSLGDFSRADLVDYERKFFRSLDGGLFTVDITPSFSERPLTAGEPVLIVLHGLTGGSHESYVRAVLSAVTLGQREGGLGMRGVVMNFRGCAGSPVLSPKLSHAGSTEDLRSLVLWLTVVMPTSPYFGLGFSMGSNVLVKYCGEEGDACPLTAAISLANIWDYYKAGQHIESGSIINRYIYDFVLGDSLRNLIKVNLRAFANETRFSVADLLKRRLIRMRYYCDVINSHLGGFKSADDYYTQVSSTQYISRVRTPILAINARDDPMAYEPNLPYAEVRESPYIVLATTGGGHMGWFEAKTKRWYVNPVREFFEAFLQLKMKARPRPRYHAATKSGMVLQMGREDVGYSEVTKDVANSDGIFSG